MADHQPYNPLIELVLNRDARGNLLVGQAPDQLPFVPVRFFVVSGVPVDSTRGTHAHRSCEQVLICLAGRVDVTSNDGTTLAEYTLEPSSHALHIPPLVWGSQTYRTDDAILLVLASQQYDAAEYITDFAEFESLTRTQ